MRPTAGPWRAEPGMGPFWGARYSRTWFTMLASLPLLCGVFFSVLGGTGAWVVLLPLAVVIVAVVWLVPLSVVGAKGIRLVLRGQLVWWADIESVLDPRPGDEEVRVEMDGGRVLRLPGIPPRSASAIRALHNTHR